MASEAYNGGGRACFGGLHEISCSRAWRPASGRGRACRARRRPAVQQQCLRQNMVNGWKVVNDQTLIVDDRVGQQIHRLAGQRLPRPELADAAGLLAAETTSA